MTYILKTHQLTKVYHDQIVVSDVNMNVRKGEIYGFLGPNGAGKTTVMKMITSLVKPSAGKITIFGREITKSSYDFLKRIGTVIEYPIFYEQFTSLKNLVLHCEYMGYPVDKRHLENVLSFVDLNHVEDKPVKDFSLGMKQRLGIARAIVTEPDILILDEPLNGLDPEGIHDMRNLFITLSHQYGMTLLISSHILGEIEQIAHTIGVIRDGNLIKEVAMDSIRNGQSNYVELRTPHLPKAEFVLKDILHLKNFYKNEKHKVLRIYETSISSNKILENMINHDVEIDLFQHHQPSLEDYFLRLVHGDDQNVTFD